MDRPFLHLFILTRIKKKTRSVIVNKTFLRDQIGRILLRAGGLPKFMIKYIIEDMVKLGLIESINHRDLYKLLECDEEKKVNILFVEG